MKKLFYCFCICAFSIINGIYAQQQDSSGFIYSKEAQELNFPQFDCSVLIPPQVGFKVPFIRGKNSLLEMDSQVYYYFDEDYLVDVNLFELKFSLSPEDENDCLSFYVLPAGEYRIKQEIDYLKSIYPSGTYRLYTPVASEMGEFHVFRIKLPNDNIYESYLLSKGNNSYLFRLNGNIPADKKEKYKNIITRFKEKNLAYRRIRYEAKMKESNFAVGRNDSVQEIRLSENQGILLSPFTFGWVNPGISLQIPSGFKYQVGGEMDRTTSTKIEVFTEKSLNIGSNLSRFYNENISINITDHLSFIQAENSINLRVQSARYSDTLQIVVDGMPVDAVFYGGKESGVLLFCIQADEDIREISFSGVTNLTLPLIERIISSIRLDIPKQGLYTRRSESIASLLKLEGPGTVSLDQPLPLKELSSETKYKCVLADLGIRLQLPGNPDSYNYEMDKTKIRNIRQVKNGVIPGKPLDNLRVWGSNPESPSYTITKEEIKLPLEKDIREKRREWSNYKNTEVIHASLIRANGIDWSVLFFKSGEMSYGGMMTAYKGDYKITINIPYQTQQEGVFEKAAFIKSVWFKVLPDYR